MTNSIPVPGEFYRHFKNKMYQIIAVATHSETKEKLVIYQALYGDYSVYARPLDMFISEVDHEKYPDVTQKFRFEKVDMTEKTAENMAVNTAADTAFDKTLDKTVEVVLPDADTKVSEDKTDIAPDPFLMEFLDIRSVNDKMKFLSENKKKLTDELINAMAASLDVTVPDGPIELRYSSLRTCLQTKAKYEINRLR